MKKVFSKILKYSAISVTLLTFVAAPAIQAIQISKTVKQLNQACTCCCCDSAEQEKSCPAKAIQKSDRCPCKIDQPAPINSAPIVSTVSKDNHKYSTVISELPQNSLLAQDAKSSKIIVKDNLPKKHPPLFILNASLLI